MNESRETLIYFCSMLAFLGLKNDFIRVQRRRKNEWDIHMNDPVIYEYIRKCHDRNKEVC